MIEFTKKLTTQIIAVVQIILSVITIVTLSAIMISIFLDSKYRPSSDLDPSFVTELFGTSNALSFGLPFAVFLLILGIIFNLVTLDLGVVLWNAAKHKQWARCSDWLVGQSLMVGISIVIFALETIFLPTTIIYVTKGVVGIGINLFFIWSVLSYINDLRQEEDFVIATVSPTEEGSANGGFGWTCEIAQNNLDRPPRPGIELPTPTLPTLSAKETQID